MISPLSSETESRLECWAGLLLTVLWPEPCPLIVNETCCVMAAKGYVMFRRDRIGG